MNDISKETGVMLYKSRETEVITTLQCYSVRSRVSDVRSCNCLKKQGDWGLVPILLPMLGVFRTSTLFKKLFSLTAVSSATELKKGRLVFFRMHNITLHNKNK